MAKNQAVWALDIGQSALKALKLAPGESADVVIAEAFDFVEYPKILSQPDADPEALISEALGTFLDRNDIKGSKVAIAVPGQAGLVKFIKLPPVEKKRIPDIVKFEAKQQIPFALEEVVWAYQQIGDKDEADEEEFSTVEVGLFAMKRDQINRAIQPFKTAGIEIDVVQMGPIALYNYVTFDMLKGTDLKGSIVLLDIGADNTDLIISDGTRIWQRNVPIGGNHFTRALTKELKLTFAKAEHLKRNATKAPDPKAVFTAMRGIFNDFASEVNRSIGFYSSVNRTAKIIKVVGLGNGFKLPGLQKFLQQNLNGLEVEKLEDFAKLTGEEVKTAPQFVENLPSFAVAFGLGLQGIGRSQLKTNLLPPEVEQVRIICRKKPWALAASALLMLGFAFYYMGDYRAYGAAKNADMDSAIGQTKSVSTQGSGFISSYNTAKTEYEGKLKEGKALVISDDQRATWPKFLKLVNAQFPDPAAEYRLDPAIPKNIKVLDLLRVHIDKVKPVFRMNVAEDGFTNLPEWKKATMHPLDRKETPSGEGWIIQIACHHYNPTPTKEELKVPLTDPKRMAFGPYNYIILKILPRFWGADLRAQGIHHTVLASKITDVKWTTDSGSRGNNPASKLLDRASAPAAAGGGPAGGPAPGGRMGDSDPRSAGGPAPGGTGTQAMSMPISGRSGGPIGGGSTAAADKIKQTTLTRTDFVIQFIWQPFLGDAKPKPIEDYRKALDDATNDPKNQEAIRAIDTTKLETLLEAESVKGAIEASKAQTPPAGGPTTTPPGAVRPGGPTPAAPPTGPGTTSPPPR